jgi:Flp/Fap pilin component
MIILHITYSNTGDEPIHYYMSIIGPLCGTSRSLVGQKEFAMKNLISSFFEDETAATAIEYGLIAVGISVQSSPSCRASARS